MKKKGILLAAVILLSAAGLIQAQEGELGVTLDVTYLSRYIWRGIDLYNNNTSAIQPSIDIDFYGTGFGVTVLSSRANGRGFENAEELDITLYYYNSLFENETYATDYRVGWVYYDYPDRASKGPKVDAPRPLIPVVETLADVQELYAVFAWPEILGVKGLVPSYIFAHIWPAQSNSNATDNGGWIHALGLDYGIPTALFLPDMPAEQILKLSSLAVYNSGVGATGMVDHDWSHFTFGLSTEFAITDNVSFTPAIYYQLSMDDSINDDDETWCGLSMTYKF